MKANLFLFFSLVFLFASCTKVTTSKLIGKWEFEKSAVFEEYVYASDSTLNYSREIRFENNTQHTIVRNHLGITTLDTNENFPNYLMFEFFRDGSFTKTYYVIHPNTNVLSSNEASGSWSFLGEDKVNNLEKNQRVFLNITDSHWKHELIGSNTLTTVLEGNTTNGGEFPLFDHETKFWYIQSINKTEMIHYWETTGANNDTNGNSYLVQIKNTHTFLKK